jgi:hypothetical protein
MEVLRVRLTLQAFGLAEEGKRSVDCFPGTAVLETCSSRSSAVARLGLGIFLIRGWPLGVRSVYLDGLNRFIQVRMCLRVYMCL